ncbi:MAG: cyclic nucleotide-binding domain-containing protein [Limnohabitans sp.]|nr:cyclic nucleotide-binding domain-containing protein [Limnohabitans sp.]
MEQAIMNAFCAHFSTLAQELGTLHTATLLKGVTVLELPEGRQLIRHRMPVDSIYFIVAGTVRVSVEDGPTSIVLNVLGPGQWLGEVSVLSGELMASATITTQTPARFLRMRHQMLEDLITTNQAVATVLLPHLVLMLADRLRKSYQLEASLAMAQA